MKLNRTLMALVIGLLMAGLQTFAPTASAAGPAATVNVTTDFPDLAPGDGVCDTMSIPGLQCSLRAAIEELNARGAGAAPYAIWFNIPGPGPHALVPLSSLPNIMVPVEIDGITQPGATCPTDTAPAALRIVLNGSNAQSSGLFFGAGSDGSTLRGLVIGDFWPFSLAIFSDNNQVACSHVGVGVDGVADIGRHAHGVAVYGSGNTIGGQVSPSQRNVISARFPYTGLSLFGDRNTVWGNFIGTNAQGDGAVGGGNGIQIIGDSNIIGGRAALAGNVISGNLYGLTIQGGDRNVIWGNKIGLASDGISTLPNDVGVLISYEAIGNVIGGTGPGEANWIANNSRNGVDLRAHNGETPVQNPLRGNAIFENGSLGIDLGDDGVDLNDPGDIDAGENERQNHPVLTANPGSIRVRRTLDSHPSFTFTLDVYRSPSCDPSGYGEGEVYLGTWQAATDAGGLLNIELNLAGLAADGDVVTATPPTRTATLLSFPTA